MSKPFIKTTKSSTKASSISSSKVATSSGSSFHSSRYTFTLQVDTYTLDGQLGCIPIQNTLIEVPENTTKIADILPNSTVSYLDPNKKNKRCIVTMKDQMSLVVLPPTTDKKCWWWHIPIKGSPIGCPIKFIPNTKKSSYFSHSQKRDITTIVEEEEGYYLTIGMFSEWGCVLGYAESKKDDPVYRESISLIYKMFKESGNESPLKNPKDFRDGQIPLKPYPPFSMLKDYGGPLSIEEILKNSNVDTFKNSKNLYIRMVPIGEIYDVVNKF